MRLADGLRRHGFRTWYTRELTQGHLHLLLLLLNHHLNLNLKLLRLQRMSR